MKTEWFSLEFNIHRQVKITTDIYTKELLLYKDGSPYFISPYCARWKYVGCGIDSAHSFIGWFRDDISRKSIKKEVKSVKVLNNIIHFFDDLADKVTDILPAPYDYDSKRRDEYFTTPNMLKKGLKKLLNRYVLEKLSHQVVSYKKGNDIDVITRIEQHLSMGMPVIALINSGTHWVTIVGMTIYYHDAQNSEINIENTQITYIDLTRGTTVENTKYKNLKILGWEHNTKRKWTARVGYDSYHEGSLISITNHQLYMSYKFNSYHIKVVTGNKENAYRDGDIYITLVGDNWESPKYRVQTICNDFKPYTASEFSIVSDDYFGDIKEIIVEIESKENSKWFLSSIFIRKENKIYSFRIDRWIENKTKLISNN